MDVAIVGIGMHPFGRTPTMTGLEQGAAAARAALADAGTDFKTCLLYTSPSPRDS